MHGDARLDATDGDRKVVRGGRAALQEAKRIARAQHQRAQRAQEQLRTVGTQESIACRR